MTKTSQAPIDFKAIKTAVVKARKAAEREARQAGRSIYYKVMKIRVNKPFVRSRGTAIRASDAENEQRSPLFAAKGQPWHRTKLEIVTLVAEVLDKYPAVDRIYIDGGFELIEHFYFKDYNPHVSSWSVTVWTRAGGYDANIDDRQNTLNP